MKIRTCVILGLGYVAGCAVRPAPEGSSGSSGGSTGSGEAGESSGVPTTGGAGGTSTSTASGTGTGGATGTTGGSGPELTTGGETCDFVCESTGGDTGGFAWCDVFAQDCPEGEKCAAYADDGGSPWNALGCVPVGGDGQPGEPCTVQGGGASGLDDCAKGAMCWDVDVMNNGTCVALCTGSESAPMCAEGFHCPIAGDGVLTICLPKCDPLGQECADDDVCIMYNDVFMCVADASGDEGQVFDPCEFISACDVGLLCLNPSAATECDANAGGCCLPFCDLSDPNVACPGVGQECLSVYGEGMAPPEFAKVGICVIPG